MYNLIPIIGSFTAGYLTVSILKWSFNNISGLFKHVTSVGRMKLALIVRTDLGMDKGKSASQCAQAAISCYKRSLIEAPALLQIWEIGGQPKIVLKPDVTGEEILLQYKHKAESLGLVSSVIRNEQDLVTAIGIGPGSDGEINKIVGHLKLL